MIFIMSVSAYDIPTSFNIQGELSNTAGTYLHGNYLFQFNIYNQSENLNYTYSKTLKVQNGIFSSVLPDITPEYFRRNPYTLLGVKIESDDEMTPRINLTAMPYAIVSEYCSQATEDFLVGDGYNNGGITLDDIGDVWMDGSVFLTGNITIVNTNELNLSGNILPTSDNTYNLGSRERRFKNGYFGDVINASSLNVTTAIITGNTYLATSSGNVGIGTTTPDSKLDINGTLTLQPINFISTIQTNNADSLMTFITNRAVQSNLAYQFQVDGGTAILNIKDDGRIGIGTSTPSEVLHIAGSNAGLRISDSDISDAGGFVSTDSNIFALSGNRKYAGSSLNTSKAASMITFYTNTLEGYISFYTTNTNNAAAIERARITNIGNVGIGTTNPQNKLEIANGTIRLNFTNGCQGTCNKGTIAWNESNNKMCVCVATNTWYYANLTA